MKIVIKPLGALVLGVFVVSSLAFVAIPRRANPASGKYFFDVPLSRVTVSLPAPKDASLDTIPLVDTPGGNKSGLRLLVNRAEPKASYKIQLGADIPSALKTGQKLTLVFWARSNRETLKSHAVIEQNYEPWFKFLDKDIELTPAWKEFRIPFAVTRDTAPGKSAIHFHGGYSTGNYQFTGIRIE